MRNRIIKIWYLASLLFIFFSYGCKDNPVETINPYAGTWLFVVYEQSAIMDSVAHGIDNHGNFDILFHTAPPSSTPFIFSGYVDNSGNIQDGNVQNGQNNIGRFYGSFHDSTASGVYIRNNINGTWTAKKR